MAQRDSYYESIMIAYLDQMLKSGQYTSMKNISKQVGISTMTLVNAVRRLVTSGRLSATRPHTTTRFEYKILIPPTDHDRAALNFQLALAGGTQSQPTRPEALC